MLQPMHSRMSSGRPSSILRGRYGSAMEGRAAPMKSRMPWRIMRTMVSGEVKRPTPTTGLEVRAFRPRTHCSSWASALKRDVTLSSSQVPGTKSHRSGISPSSPITSSISARSMPSRYMVSSTVIRQATAARPATSSTASSSSSRSSRIRLRRLPPYSSLRWL